jgi:hypothetical protein
MKSLKDMSQSEGVSKHHNLEDNYSKRLILLNLLENLSSRGETLSEDIFITKDELKFIKFHMISKKVILRFSKDFILSDFSLNFKVYLKNTHSKENLIFITRSDIFINFYNAKRFSDYKYHNNSTWFSYGRSIDDIDIKNLSSQINGIYNTTSTYNILHTYLEGSDSSLEQKIFNYTKKVKNFESVKQIINLKLTEKFNHLFYYILKSCNLHRNNKNSFKSYTLSCKNSESGLIFGQRYISTKTKIFLKNINDNSRKSYFTTLFTLFINDLKSLTHGIRLTYLNLDDILTIYVKISPLQVLILKFLELVPNTEPN